jgi:hypothetical protein
VPLATIAEALPYVNWILIATLAVGTFAFAALARETTDVTRGYAGFSIFAAGLLALLALLSDFGLPEPTQLVVVQAPAEVELARRIGLAGFIGASLAYFIAIRRDQRNLLLPVAGLALALLALAAAALGWAPTLVDSVPLLLQLIVLSAATGGALSTLALGHRYLVTPRLSERPLVLLTRLLTLAIGLQLLLFIAWTTLGGGPGQGPFDAFTGGAVFLVGLRLVVSLAFALALSYMAMRTAMTRSMESSTGLLYIGLAAVLAGTIGAAALYVSTGLLV